MEIDPLVVYGAFAALFMFLLKEIISLRTKIGQREVEYEKRLSRIEAIMNLYFLKAVPEKHEKYNDVKVTSYLKDAEIEIFGKNFLIKSNDVRNPLKKDIASKKKGKGTLDS
jgi:hypothetical protein